MVNESDHPVVGRVRGITDLTCLPAEVWVSVVLQDSQLVVDACLEQEVGYPVNALKLLGQLVVVTREAAKSPDSDYKFNYFVIPSPAAVERSCVCCA